MKVDFQNDGYSSCIDFSSLRGQLVSENKVFDQVSLRSIPYSQLFLCCIGSAGSAMCSLNLVVEEKKRRRSRYVGMDPQQLDESSSFLRINQMYDDVIQQRLAKSSPCWHNLSTAQRVWTHLCCLNNHIDRWFDRTGQVVSLLNDCILDPHGSIPQDVSKTYIVKLNNLKGKNLDYRFRNKIMSMRDQVWEFLPDSDKLLLSKEYIADFSCTSDCFKVLI